MATIKEIAEQLGISRGTVDRVLHGRGKVSPEIAEKVLQKAKELNYQPNRAGVMLSLRKQPHKIGALVPSRGNPFFTPLIEGMREATRESADLGFSLEVEEVKGFDKGVHLSAIEKLKANGADALVLATLDDSDISEAIERTGLPVIAVNSDFTASSKLCYVGPDYYGKGALHAGLFSIVADKRRRILILRGSGAMRGHGDIVRGFKETLEKKGAEFSVAAERDIADDDSLAEETVREMLSKDPSINALFVATAGIAGAVRGTDGKDLLIFTSDDIPVTKELIRKGLVSWTICQEPRRQGYESVRKLQDWFIDNEKPEDLYTQNIIKLPENIDVSPS